MVNQSNKKQYKVSKLYLEALDFASRDLDDNDILQIDRTQDFFNELKKSIFAGERVFVEIHGKTRGGKSTSAMVLANKLLEFIAEHNKTKKKTIKMINVARDQSERVEKLMKESFNHDVLVTDENNDLEDTGLNITAQQALGKTISDIHAGRYVHEILISPRDFLDPNTEFMLNVVPRGMDKERQTTFLKLYVRTWDGGIDNIQLIGHVDLHVGKLIKTWEEKGKKLFFDYFHNRPEIEEYEGENDPKWIRAVKRYKRKEEEFEKLAEKDFFCYYQSIETTNVEGGTQYITFTNLKLWEKAWITTSLYDDTIGIARYEGNNWTTNTSFFINNYRWQDSINSSYLKNVKYQGFTQQGNWLKIWHQYFNDLTNYTAGVSNVQSYYREANYSFYSNYSKLTNKTYTIYRNQVVLTFLTNTGAPINISGVLIDTGTGVTEAFNTSVLIWSENLTSNEIHISFRNQTYLDGTNYTQFYEYINTPTTHETKTIYTLPDTDMVYWIEVIDENGNPIKDATIKAHYTTPVIGAQVTPKLYSQRLTKDDGKTFFFADNTYPVYYTVNKAGYDTYSDDLQPNLYTGTITVTLEKTQGYYDRGGIIFIQKRFTERNETIKGAFSTLNADKIEYSTNYRSTWEDITNTHEFPGMYRFTLIPGIDFNITGKSNIQLTIRYTIDGITTTLQTITINYDEEENITIIPDTSLINNGMLLLMIIILTIGFGIAFRTPQAGAGGFIMGTIIAGIINPAYFIILLIFGIGFAIKRVTESRTE